MKFRAVVLLLLLTACVHGQPALLTESPLRYELRGGRPDVDAPVPNADDIVANSLLEELSADEHAAFSAEAIRLTSHPEYRCRLLADAIQSHIADVRMYENAIVRYLGPDKFYGVGNSYQRGGQWMIRIARRFDDLNPRSLDDETRTLRHEIAHTLGATEKGVGNEWSANDYAYNCA
ncbi:MAG: hypothetical protein ABR582_15780 [Gemmatimonadaceae bacterium]